MSSSVHPRLLALAALVGALLLAAVAAPGAQAQATRTWVSGVGDDANPCSRTAPCKTFAGSISKTAAGGEINTLDPGGFGAVTITKAITIDGSAGGGIVVSGTPGVIVNAAATDDVTLRNIDIQTVGPGATCGQPNIAGVRVLGARSFTMIGGGVGPIGNGVQVTPASTATDVLLDGIAIRGAGCDVGVGIAPTGTGSVDATVRNATITGMASALRVGSGGRSWLSGSTLTGNTLGLDPQGTGTIASYYGTNQIHGNTTDGTPTSVIDAPIPGPVGATGAEGVPGTPGAVGPAGPAGPPGPAARSSTTTPPATKTCVVPKLTGGSLTSAKSKLTKAGCKIGTVKRLKGSRRGTKVVSQTSKAGTSKPAGAKIGVTLGKA